MYWLGFVHECHALYNRPEGSSWKCVQLQVLHRLSHLGGLSSNAHKECCVFVHKAVLVSYASNALSQRLRLLQAPQSNPQAGYCAHLIAGGGGEGMLAVSTPDRPQLGAQGPQVGMLHLLGFAILGLRCCHSCCQILFLIRF